MLFTDCSSSYKYNDISANVGNIGNTSRHNFMFGRSNTDKQDLDDMLLEDDNQTSEDVARCRSMLSKQFKIGNNIINKS